MTHPIHEELRALASRRPDWREADLHDLRIRYAALLAAIAEHRRALQDGATTDADDRLWSYAEREGR